MSKHKPWKVLASKSVYRFDPWLAVERQTVELPDGRVIDDYHRVTLQDFAGIVAQSEDGRYLVTRQYRHGPGRVARASARGGMHRWKRAPCGDSGRALDAGEAPLDAAKRELREETGYEAPRWRALGKFTVNANYGCGTAHFFAAEGARKTATVNSDDLEHTELILLSKAELLSALDRGEFAAMGAAAGILLAMR